MMSVLHAGFRMRMMIDDDLDAVTQIEAATQPTPWSRQVFVDCLASGYDCRVVVRDGEVVALAVLSSVLDEVHLLNIAVAPALHRRGIAWAMLRELVEDYRRRQMQQLYLEVRESNQAARVLYERL